MGTPQIPSVDSDTKQLPDLVRQRMAANFTDVSTPEGKAVAAAASPSRPAALITSGAIGPYDFARSLFNKTRTNTLRTQAALSAAASGSGLSTVLFIGDSTTAQYGSSLSADYLGPLLTGANVKIAGDLVAANKGGNTVLTDERVTLTGSWSPLLGSIFLQGASSAIFKFVSNRTGTIAQLTYMTTSGAQWRVDGGAWQPLQATADYVPVTATMTGLSSATHTIEFQALGSDPSWVGLAGVYAANGLLLLNLGASGTKTSDWLSQLGTQWGFLPFATGRITPVPVAVFVNLGINDWTAGLAPADFQANLGNILAQFPNFDIFIETSNPTVQSEYADYDQAKYKLAAYFGCTLVDMHDRLGTYSQGKAVGLYLNDGLHPSVAGYALKSRARFDALGAYL